MPFALMASTNEAEGFALRFGARRYAPAFVLHLLSPLFRVRKNPPPPFLDPQKNSWLISFQVLETKEA